MPAINVERPPTAPITLYLTSDAYARIQAADKEWVGTDHYMGLAYFWAHEYRYPMRDASAYKRVRIHRALMDAGLPLDGESGEHRQIIDQWRG